MRSLTLKFMLTTYLLRSSISTARSSDYVWRGERERGRGGERLFPFSNNYRIFDSEKAGKGAVKENRMASPPHLGMERLLIYLPTYLPTYNSKHRGFHCWEYARRCGAKLEMETLEQRCVVCIFAMNLLKNARLHAIKYN